MKQTGLKPGLENSLNLTSYSLFEQGLEVFQPDSIRNGSIFNLEEADISLLNALNINSKPKNGQKTPTNNNPPQKFQVSNTLKDIDDLLTRLKPTKEIQPISENNQPILQDYYSRGINDKNSKNNVLEYENNAWQNNPIVPQTTNYNNNMQYPSNSRPQPQDIYNGNQYDNTNRQQPENLYQPPPIKSQRSSKDIPPPQNTYYQPPMNPPRSTPQVSDFLGNPQDNVRAPINTNYYQQPPLNNSLRNQEIPRQQENFYPSNGNFLGQMPYEFNNGKNDKPLGIQLQNQEIPKKPENYYPSNDNYSGQKQYEYSNGINEKQGPLNNPLKNQEIPRQQENYYFSNDKSSGQKQFEITNGRNDNYYQSKSRETYNTSSQEKYYQSYQQPQETNKDYYQAPVQQEEKYYDMQMNKETYYKSASKTTQSQTEKNAYFNNSQDKYYQPPMNQMKTAQTEMIHNSQEKHKQYKQLQSNLLKNQHSQEISNNSQDNNNKFNNSQEKYYSNSTKTQQPPQEIINNNSTEKIFQMPSKPKGTHKGSVENYQAQNPLPSVKPINMSLIKLNMSHSQPSPSLFEPVSAKLNMSRKGINYWDIPFIGNDSSFGNSEKKTPELWAEKDLEVFVLERNLKLKQIAKIFYVYLNNQAKTYLKTKIFSPIYKYYLSILSNDGNCIGIYSDLRQIEKYLVDFIEALGKDSFDVSVIKIWLLSIRGLLLAKEKYNKIKNTIKVAGSENNLSITSNSMTYANEMESIENIESDDEFEETE